MVIAANQTWGMEGLAGCACARPRTLGEVMLGDAATQAKIGQIVTGSVATVGSAAAPAIANTLFASALTGVAPLWAVPVVGAAVAGVVLALTAIFGRKGPKQKEESTRLVNQVADLLKQNLDAYMAGPRNYASQATALKSFDEAWAWLISDQGCGNPALGEPGRRCIQERDRGGNIGQPGSGHGDWCPVGQQCDFFATLRDPIANDPRPAEIEAAASGSLLPSLPDVGAIAVPGVGNVSVWLLVGAALVAWGVMSQ